MARWQVVGEQAKGEFWGLEMPLTPQQLKDMGPQWLTRALHKSKALPLDNAVAPRQLQMKAGCPKKRHTYTYYTFI